MDNMTRFRLQATVTTFLQWAVIGLVLAGLAMLAPVVDRRVNPIKAHAAAFAVAVVLSLIGLGYAVLIWVRSGRGIREKAKVGRDQISN